MHVLHQIARTALMTVTNMEKESVNVATVFLKCGTPVEFEVDVSPLNYSSARLLVYNTIKPLNYSTYV